MSYDADKTPYVLAELKDAARAGDIKRVMKLLRHADAGGRLRAGSGFTAALRSAVGESAATAIARAFATDPCPYCRNGREPCEDCAGTGAIGNKVCRPCAGLGVRRCPFCNGTAFAGYDLVPRGLRPAVMKLRLEFAESQIAGAARHADDREHARQVVGRIFAVDRCRGVLANAVEQVSLDETSTVGGSAMFSEDDVSRTRRRALALNGRAEDVIRALLRRLAEGFARRAERPGSNGEARRLVAHRARHFASMSEDESLGDSALRTPAALRGD